MAGGVRYQHNERRGEDGLTGQTELALEEVLSRDKREPFPCKRVKNHGKGGKEGDGTLICGKVTTLTHGT